MNDDVTSHLYELELKPTSDNQRKVRCWWMSILAKADLELLNQNFQALKGLPNYMFLRPAEVGLVMVQGRMDGSGSPFNLGEVPITRCTVRIPEFDCIGCSYVLGRSKLHAELAAVADALLQTEVWRTLITQQILEPLQTHRHQSHQQQWQETTATKVNFFTLAREHT